MPQQHPRIIAVLSQHIQPLRFIQPMPLPRLLLTITLTLFTTGLLAQKQICITIDDLPAVGYGQNSTEDWMNITQKLIATCQERGIPAIGYVNEKKLYRKEVLDSARLYMLELWLKAGLDLGNHTFSHLDYHKSNISEYSREIMKGEQLTKPLVNRYEKDLKYFRHPYLRSGATKEASEDLEGLLNETGYTASPVTVDSDDYIFALAYARAARKNDAAEMKMIGEAYVEHTEKKLLFFEALSQAVFERNISHTYLMHASLLNADYLDELADMFESHGYSFISQKAVLEDPAYAEPVTVFRAWGISWLYRWALSRDQGTERFELDIEVPKHIQNLAR